MLPERKSHKFGKALRTARTEAKLPLKELARVTGIPVSSLASYESGRATPHLSTVERLNRIFFSDDPVRPAIGNEIEPHDYPENSEAKGQARAAMMQRTLRDIRRTVAAHQGTIDQLLARIDEALLV